MRLPRFFYAAPANGQDAMHIAKPFRRGKKKPPGREVFSGNNSDVVPSARGRRISRLAAFPGAQGGCATMGVRTGNTLHRALGCLLGGVFTTYFAPLKVQGCAFRFLRILGHDPIPQIYRKKGKYHCPACIKIRKPASRPASPRVLRKEQYIPVVFPCQRDFFIPSRILFKSVLNNRDRKSVV